VSPSGATRAMAAPERLSVAFVRLLRRSGLAVPADASIAYAEALAALGLSRRESVYWAGRATLVHRPEDLELYERAFDAFWLGRERQRLVFEVQEQQLTLLVDTAEDDDADDGPEGPEPEAGQERQLRYSAAETLREKDFGTLSLAELAEAQRLMASVRLGGALRPSRRLQPRKRRGDRPDLRRTLRHALRAGGEPLRRAWLAQGVRARRIVLLCDVSGSMEPYARALIRFLHVVVAGRARVEAFTFGTRLTRVTRELSRRDADAAVMAAARAVPDWSGGTRLGESLKAFNDAWGTRGMARGAVVVILSDGWDRGDPALLGEEMARLHRVAHRVIWVNPLKATPGYAPLARGMAAALPYVDELVEGHSLASLEALSEVVSR
jgi:uncharacterized protein with von Willebrand factor type A (vWA) domain